MSEYQYYEFLAIDKPLSQKDQAYRQALSSRANITPVSLTNSYHYGDLKQNLQAARQNRLQVERDRQKKAEKKEQKQRERYLKDLCQDYQKAWKNVERTLGRGSGLAYDEACQMVVDLKDAYLMESKSGQFEKRLKKLLKVHNKRKAFVERLSKVGLV